MASAVTLVCSTEGSVPAAGLQPLQSSRRANQPTAGGYARMEQAGKSKNEAGGTHLHSQDPLPNVSRVSSSHRARPPPILPTVPTPARNTTSSPSTPRPLSTGARDYPTPPSSALSGIFPSNPVSVLHQPYEAYFPSGPSTSASGTSSGESLNVDWREYVNASVDLSRASATNREDEGSDEDIEEEEDPFHFDKISSGSVLPPPQGLRKQPSRLAQTLLHRASITPLPPPSTSTPTTSNFYSHRFSLVRTQTLSGERVFIQELSDDAGRRWSLCVPADGLPADMVRMLDELEGLARELEQALPKIVVTQSAQSLGPVMKEIVNLKASLPGTGTEALKGTGTLKGLDSDSSLACGKEECSGESLASGEGKQRAPEHSGDTLNELPSPGLEFEDKNVSESGLAQPSPSNIPASLASDPSLKCIYLPDSAPEFLSSSSQSPVAESADRFHNKALTTPSKNTATPAPSSYSHARDSPRNAAFFTAVRNTDSPTSPLKIFSSRNTSHPATVPPAFPTPPGASFLSKHTNIFPAKSYVPVSKRSSTALGALYTSSAIPHSTRRSVSATESSATPIAPTPTPTFIKYPRKVSDPVRPSRLPAPKRFYSADAYYGAGKTGTESAAATTKAKGLLDGFPHALRTRVSRMNLNHTPARSAPEQGTQTNITMGECGDQQRSGSGSGFKAFFRRGSSPATVQRVQTEPRSTKRRETDGHGDGHGEEGWVFCPTPSSTGPELNVEPRRLPRMSSARDLLRKLK